MIIAAHLGPGFLERHGPFAQELLDRAVHHGTPIERVLDTFHAAMVGDQPPSEDTRKRLPDVLLRSPGTAGS